MVLTMIDIHYFKGCFHIHENQYDQKGHLLRIFFGLQTTWVLMDDGHLISNDLSK